MVNKKNNKDGESCPYYFLIAEMKDIYGFFGFKYFLIPIPVVYLTQNGILKKRNDDKWQTKSELVF